jgi:DNA-binding GntR family transcriptional regulator
MEESPAAPQTAHDDGLGEGVDALHERLRRDILEGRLAPGTSLSQVQLGQQHGVSRTKLREAMRMLVDEGLIELRPRGARVADVSGADLDEIYAQRLMMESLALRRSAPRLSPDDVAELEGLLAQMAHFERVGDYARWDRPHRAFHALLVTHSGPRTRTVLAQLDDHAMRYRTLFHASTDARSAADAEHRAILDAVIAQDTDAVVGAVVRHLARNLMDIVRQVEPGYEPVTMAGALEQLLGDAALPTRAG